MSTYKIPDLEWEEVLYVDPIEYRSSGAFEDYNIWKHKESKKWSMKYGDDISDLIKNNAFKTLENCKKFCNDRNIKRLEDHLTKV